MNDIATQKNHSQVVCSCPHCNSASLTRSGFDRGTQRYRCKNCQRTFKATAGTPVHGLHKKEKIGKYLKALRKGMSVRKAADYVGISKNTSFAWRHKFLSSLEARSAVTAISHISSAEMIRLKYSAKGRKKPPEQHRSATLTIALFRDGQLELHKLPPVKHSRHVAKVFSESTASYFAATPNRTITASVKHAENAVMIKKRQISQPLIAKAKQQEAKLHCWMQRFKGVASKYLQNYWNWYASLLNLSQLKHETKHFATLCTNSRSLTRYYITKNL